jgi:hypothetical protein
LQDGKALPSAPVAKESANGSKTRDLVYEKQKELMELQKKKVALELLQTKALLDGKPQPFNVSLVSFVSAEF